MDYHKKYLKYKKKYLELKMNGVLSKLWHNKIKIVFTPLSTSQKLSKNLCRVGISTTKALTNAVILGTLTEAVKDTYKSAQIQPRHSIITDTVHHMHNDESIPYTCRNKIGDYKLIGFITGSVDIEFSKFINYIINDINEHYKKYIMNNGIYTNRSDHLQYLIMNLFDFIDKNQINMFSFIDINKEIKQVIHDIKGIQKNARGKKIEATINAKLYESINEINKTINNNTFNQKITIDFKKIPIAMKEKGEYYFFNMIKYFLIISDQSNEDLIKNWDNVPNNLTKQNDIMGIDIVNAIEKFIK